MPAPPLQWFPPQPRFRSHQGWQALFREGLCALLGAVALGGDVLTLFSEEEAEVHVRWQSRDGNPGWPASIVCLPTHPRAPPNRPWATPTDEAHFFRLRWEGPRSWSPGSPEKPAAVGRLARSSQEESTRTVGAEAFPPNHPHIISVSIQKHLQEAGAEQGDRRLPTGTDKHESTQARRPQVGSELSDIAQEGMGPGYQ